MAVARRSPLTTPRCSGVSLAAVADARVRTVAGFAPRARFATVVGRSTRNRGELVRGKLQGAALPGLALEELAELLRCRLTAMPPQKVLDNAFPHRLDKGLLQGVVALDLAVQFLQLLHDDASSRFSPPNPVPLSVGASTAARAHERCHHYNW